MNYSDEKDEALRIFQEINKSKRKKEFAKSESKKEEEKKPKPKPKTKTKPKAKPKKESDSSSSSSSEEEDENEFFEEQDQLSGLEKKAKEIAAQYKFNHFDYDSVPLDAAILVVGKRRYGKSTWTDHFLSHRWFFYPDGGFCFTRTKFNYFWHQRFPETRIYEGMKWDVVAKILQTQKEKVESIIHNGEKKGEETIPYILVILDDIVADQHDMRNEVLLNELMFAGRHYKVCIIINTQDIKALSPGVRNNFDIIATTYQTQERSIETLKGEYGDFFPNKRVFREIIKMNTQDHQMLIIDQTVAKYRPIDCFFIDKAELHPEPYKIGDDQFWIESECDWKDQLKLYNNIPNHDKEEWTEIAKRQWEDSKHFKPNKEFSIASNNPYFSKIPRKPDSTKSHVAKTLELINEKKFGVKYIPGPFAKNNAFKK